MPSIGIVMTCFNRREKTLKALSYVFDSDLPDSVQLHVYVTDDGSSDGTAEALSKAFPSVRVLHGSGNLYWNGGMRSSLAAAYTDRVDYVLWLNDDTFITRSAIQELLDAESRCTVKTSNAVVIVGTTRDDLTGMITYGGARFPVWWKKTSPRVVEPLDNDIECETMNGNIVLIPRKVYLAVGNLEAGFIHGMGDFDYGFRVRKAGFQIFAAKGHHGFCSPNNNKGTFRDISLSFSERWPLVCGPKGRPPGPWAVYTRRHCGPFWFLYWAWPYLYTLCSSVIISRRKES
jgi:GT2 family glycosyltransferase